MRKPWGAITHDFVVVLVPLDESSNAVVSFGYIDAREDWGNKSGGVAISSGFAPLDDGAGPANSTPHVTAVLTKEPARCPSKFTIDWDLDPIILADAIDRTNTTIAPTGKLPNVLNVIIFYDMKDIPFVPNNFGQSYAINLWGNNRDSRKSVTYGSAFANVILTIEVNGFREKKYSYVLKQIYKLHLLTDEDDDIESGCTVLQFEAA